MDSYLFSIEGMHCNSCVLKIEKLLKSELNIEKADISLDNKNIHLSFDKSKIKSIHIKQEIEKIGFQVVKIQKISNES